MTTARLKAARLAGGWTQSQAASRSGVSQPYYSQLESGYRVVPKGLAQRAIRELRLPPTALPLPALNPGLPPLDPHRLTAQLARLGYPGFAHMNKAKRPMNPALVIAGALAHTNLDVRLVEALPWVLPAFPDMEFAWLIGQCRLMNQQNRLGYLVSLATKSAKQGANSVLAEALVRLESSRLAGEGTLCRESMSAVERTWARRRRPPEAAHWNLLTTLTADELTHAA